MNTECGPRIRRQPVKVLERPVIKQIKRGTPNSITFGSTGPDRCHVVVGDIQGQVRAVPVQPGDADGRRTAKASGAVHIDTVGCVCV